MEPAASRKLGNIEYTWAKMDDFVPVIFVGVLHLTNGPSPDVLQQALNTMQARQLMLRVAFSSHNDDFFFEETGETSPFPMKTLDRTDTTQWRKVTEDHLNTPIETSTPPLARCTYLYSQEQSELILGFHHTIIDSRSGQAFIHQLLSLCAEISADKKIDGKLTASKFLPAMEDMYPPAFSGARRIWRTASFMVRQMAGEIVYRHKLGRKQLLHKDRPTRSRILCIELPEDTTTLLAKSARRRRIPLNSLLQAAMLISVARHQYAGQSLPMRGISFADMRPHLKPPLSADRMGVYISMLQYTVSMSSSPDFWALATGIRDQIYQATKQGDKFIAALMSKQLIRFLTRRQSMRMGMVALSYVGPMKMEPAFGGTTLNGLSGFVANNILGPELAGFGKILHGRLSLDLLYLDSDMDPEKARAIAGDIRSMLENLKH